MSMYDKRIPRGNATVEKMAKELLVPRNMVHDPLVNSLLNTICVHVNNNAELRFKAFEEQKLNANTPWMKLFKQLSHLTDTSRMLIAFVRRGDTPTSITYIEKQLEMEHVGMRSRSLVEHGLLVYVKNGREDCTHRELRQFVFRPFAPPSAHHDSVDPQAKRMMPTTDVFKRLVAYYMQKFSPQKPLADLSEKSFEDIRKEFPEIFDGDDT